MWELMVHPEDHGGLVDMALQELESSSVLCTTAVTVILVDITSRLHKIRLPCHQSDVGLHCELSRPLGRIDLRRSLPY